MPKYFHSVGTWLSLCIVFSLVGAKFNRKNLTLKARLVLVSFGFCLCDIRLGCASFDIHRIFRGCKVIWIAAWYKKIKVLGFGFLVFPFVCLCQFMFSWRKVCVCCCLFVYCAACKNSNWDIPTWSNGIESMDRREMIAMVWVEDKISCKKWQQ